MKLMGIPVSEGCALGKAVVLKPFRWRLPDEAERALDKADEKEKLMRQVQALSGEYQASAVKLEQAGKKEQADFMRSHDEILHDCLFEEEAFVLVEEGYSACEAVRRVAEAVEKTFCETENSSLRERITDIRDVASRLIRLLRGEQSQNIEAVESDSVVFADELPTSVMAGLENPHIKAIVTAKGGKTSHTGILAKNRGLPAVMGCRELDTIPEGCEVFVNGDAGTVEFNFSVQEQAEYKKKIEQEQEQEQELHQYIQQKTVTRDGHEVSLCANLLDARMVDGAVQYRADGIGLFRTEMLFLERKAPPDETEQKVVYQSVLEKMGGLPVILRTMDIGGDKVCDYLEQAKEENPFLGVRGIRLSLQRPALFRTQLRALLRAGVHGNAQVMLPMVSTLEEIRLVKRLVAEVEQELESEGLAHAQNIPLGIMVEVPSAAVMADTLVREVDFVSIGSNDLTQYIMAADRYNHQTAGLCATYQPAVLRTLAHVASCCAKQNKPCGLCGEAAGDLLLVPFLVGIGLPKLSVNLNALLKTRRCITKLSFCAAAELAQNVLQTETAEQAYTLLKKFREQMERGEPEK